MDLLGNPPAHNRMMRHRSDSNAVATHLPLQIDSLLSAQFQQCNPPADANVKKPSSVPAVLKPEAIEQLLAGINPANKGAEIWASMREWLKTGGHPQRPGADRRTHRTGSMNVKKEIVLEKKEDIKKRGLSTPDNADGLGLTFAYPGRPEGRSPRAAVGQAPSTPTSSATTPSEATKVAA